MAKKVTIRDVAAEAGVSLGTIDRVLNKKGNVSPEKTRAVIEAVKKLGYKPSRVAQTLALQREIKIGVVYPDVEEAFWSEIYMGIRKAEKELSPYGLEVIYKPTKTYSIDEQLDAMAYLKDHKVDGIALMPTHTSRLNDEINNLVEQGNIAVATFVSDAPKSKRLCFVGQNLVRSGILAGELMALLLKGEGKVAVLRAQRDVLAIQQRISGFIEKIQTEYPQMDIAGFYDMYEVDNAEMKVYADRAYSVTCQLIEERPDIDGIFVTNALTNWVGKAIKDMKKAGKIKVVGYDLSKEVAKQLKDGVIQAVICQDPISEGYYPIKYLYNYLIKGRPPEKEIFYTKLDIVIKENVEWE
jgi:LacI family transcriptional regulator